MIRLQHISTGYVPGLDILQNIDLCFADQGIYALVDPSGTGKTTLFKLLCGLIKPTSGQIDGLQGKRIVMQFQEDRLLSWRSVLQNVMLAMACPQAEDARQILNALCIEDVETYPASFSGGMKRRVSLARAIACKAEILLLDEPFSGMDEALKARIAPYVRQAAPLIIFSTHDLAEASLMGAQTLTLRSGSQAAEPLRTKLDEVIDM